MANISDLRREVKFHAHQCPDVTIDYAIIRALRTFCRDSWYYQATMLIDQVNGTTSYTLVPSDGSEVIAVSSVELDPDTKIYPLKESEATRPDGTVTGFLFEPPSYLSIYPQPTTDVTNGIEVRAVLMPPENTTTIPDSVYRNWKECIVAGALSFILSTQNDSWSNPQLAQAKLQEFNLGIFAAKAQRMRDFRPNGIRIGYRPFTTRGYY